MNRLDILFTLCILYLAIFGPLVLLTWYVERKRPMATKRKK